MKKVCLFVSRTPKGEHLRKPWEEIRTLIRDSLVSAIFLAKGKRRPAVRIWNTRNKSKLQSAVAEVIKKYDVSPKDAKNLRRKVCRSTTRQLEIFKKTGRIGVFEIFNKPGEKR